jgi:2-keto-4-pentenoate hydratase/2-oxohepta-3-ene-1,7-dioic acid hydratase in catechol pathway
VKLISFRTAGSASYGAVVDGEVIDLGAALGAALPDLKSFLGAGAEKRPLPSSVPRLPLAGVELLPVIPNPSKIFCIGHNYESHRAEMGRAKSTFPAVFLRFADSQLAHEQPAWVPGESTEIDFEGELAVVIGKGGRRITRADALAHVAGYACYNDISVRDWQRHTTQFSPGKNFPRTGLFGPWLVTADEIPDPQALEIATRLNGDVVQQAKTDQMIFSVAEIIEYCSTFTPLSAGDVIVSGTPGGVGAKREPPLWMKPGDRLEVEISSIGTVRTTLEREP